MKRTGIYVHIPFCKQKCKYCDFISFSNMNQYISDYINCILKEIEDVSELNKLNYESKVEELIQVDTIYIQKNI